jgi:hypothetical protein
MTELLITIIKAFLGKDTLEEAFLRYTNYESFNPSIRLDLEYEAFIKEEVLPTFEDRPILIAFWFMMYFPEGRYDLPTLPDAVEFELDYHGNRNRANLIREIYTILRKEITFHHDYSASRQAVLDVWNVGKDINAMNWKGAVSVLEMDFDTFGSDGQVYIQMKRLTDLHHINQNKLREAAGFARRT